MFILRKDGSVFLWVDMSQTCLACLGAGGGGGAAVEAEAGVRPAHS